MLSAQRRPSLRHIGSCFLTAVLIYPMSITLPVSRLACLRLQQSDGCRYRFHRVSRPCSPGFHRVPVSPGIPVIITGTFRPSPVFGVRWTPPESRDRTSPELHRSADTAPEPFGRRAALAIRAAAPRYLLLPNRGIPELENQLSHSKQTTATFSNRGRIPAPRALLLKSSIAGQSSLLFANRYNQILEAAENKDDDLC